MKAPTDLDLQSQIVMRLAFISKAAITHWDKFPDEVRGALEHMTVHLVEMAIDAVCEMDHGEPDLPSDLSLRGTGLDLVVIPSIERSE